MIESLDLDMSDKGESNDSDDSDDDNHFGDFDNLSDDNSVHNASLIGSGDCINLLDDIDSCRKMNISIFKIDFNLII